MKKAQKEQRPIDEYVAEIEAKYGGAKSNRTLIAELSGTERVSERGVYKEGERLVVPLLEQWDRETHAARGEKEHKDVTFHPHVIVSSDKSKIFFCTLEIAHYDLGRLGKNEEIVILEETHTYKASSLDELRQTLAEAYKLALPYVQKGFKPSMTSVRTVTPEIHFPGYCPSPIPEYVTSLKKQYSEPTVFTYKHEYVRKRLVETKPWYPVPDEPKYMLIAFELTDGHSLYEISTLLYTFRPLVGLKLEKKLAEGYAIPKQSVYALTWLGITPFARELTRWHTYETYYQEQRSH